MTGNYVNTDGCVANDNTPRNAVETSKRRTEAASPCILIWDSLQHTSLQEPATQNRMLSRWSFHWHLEIKAMHMSICVLPKHSMCILEMTGKKLQVSSNDYLRAGELDPKG